MKQKPPTLKSELELIEMVRQLCYKNHVEMMKKSGGGGAAICACGHGCGRPLECAGLQILLDAYERDRVHQATLLAEAKANRPLRHL